MVTVMSMSRTKKAKGSVRGAIARLAAVFALAALVFVNAAVFLVAAPENEAYASGPGKLTIRVGYAGTEFIEKKVYTESQLRSLGLVKNAYSYIDMGNFPRLQAARGVPLKDIVRDAGIDIGSVQRFYFVASDGHETSGDMTALSIIHTKRYFYPNLIECWDMETDKPGVGAAEDRKEVETIIAVESYTADRYDPVIPWDKMDSKNTYRLAFGMPSVDSVGGMHDSVKWIESIDVQLVGSPPEDFGKNDEDDTLGSDPSNKDKDSDKDTDSGKDTDKDKDTGKDKPKEEPKPDPPKQENKSVYTVTYVANGGSGYVAARQYAEGSVATAADGGAMKRDGYVFSGWSQNKNASTPKYRPGDTFIVKGNVMLYAVWKKATTGGGTGDENTGKAGPRAGHGKNPGIASDGKTTVDFGGGQNPSVTGGITTVANPKLVSGAELKSAGSLSSVQLMPGGASGGDNPWMVYEVSPDSTPLKLPPPKDGTMPLAVGLLGGAFAVGGLYSFTSLSTKGLWLLHKLFLIK